MQCSTSLAGELDSSSHDEYSYGWGAAVASEPGPCHVDDVFFKDVECSAYLNFENAFYRTTATA